MSETNDNLSQVASEETTTTQQQAEGAEGSVSQGQGSAPQGTTEQLILGKFRNADELAKAYQNLEKLASRKTVDPSALGLTQTQVQQAEQGQQVQATTTQRQEVRQEVQQASSSSQLGQWVQARLAEGYSQADVIAMIADARANHAAQAVLQQVLAPVTAQQNTLIIRSVTQSLTEEYEDFDQVLPEIKSYLDANPHIKSQIQSKDTDEATKRYHLENAYLRVARGKSKSVESAAKAAGAVESKRTEQMKAASVTGGSGAGARNQGNVSTSADEWEKVARQYEKGRRLFE